MRSVFADPAVVATWLVFFKEDYFIVTLFNLALARFVGMSNVRTLSVSSWRTLPIS